MFMHMPSNHIPASRYTIYMAGWHTLNDYKEVPRYKAPSKPKKYSIRANPAHKDIIAVLRWHYATQRLLALSEN